MIWSSLKGMGFKLSEIGAGWALKNQLHMEKFSLHHHFAAVSQPRQTLTPDFSCNSCWAPAMIRCEGGRYKQKSPDNGHLRELSPRIAPFASHHPVETPVRPSSPCLRKKSHPCTTAVDRLYGAAGRPHGSCTLQLTFSSAVSIELHE